MRILEHRPGGPGLDGSAGAGTAAGLGGTKTDCWIGMWSARVLCASNWYAAPERSLCAAAARRSGGGFPGAPGPPQAISAWTFSAAVIWRAGAQRRSRSAREYLGLPSRFLRRRRAVHLRR